MKIELIWLLALFVVGILFCSIKKIVEAYKNKVQENKNQIARREQIIKAYKQWFYLRLEDKSVSDYFAEKEYRSIVVYGMGHIGKCLCDELIKENIDVKYAIDQNAGYKYNGIIVYSLEEAFSTEDVDVIVVTVASGFDKIRMDLEEIANVPIVDFFEVLGWLQNK